MATDDKIRDEKLQYDINREADMNILHRYLTYLTYLDRHEYLTGEEVLPSGPIQIVQHAKCRYSPLGKTFEKQTEKKVDALTSLNVRNKIELKQTEIIFTENHLNDFIIDKLKEIMQLQNKRYTRGKFVIRKC